MPVTIKSQNEIDIMRSAGGINAEVREILLENISPGITGFELDRLAPVSYTHLTLPTICSV